MSTNAPSLLMQLCKDWESKTGLHSAVCSGVVGDLAHRARGGYHISRQDQPASNYSVIRPEDKAGNGPDDMASAIDMTMSSADMITCTKRLMAAYSNPGDPRRKYLNAFNGWLGVGAAQRFDFYARKVEVASADHTWHVHLEVRRKYINSATAMAAILSLLSGQSLAAYLAGLGIGSASKAVATKAPAFPGTLKRDDNQTTPNAGVKAFQAQMIKRGWTSLGSADGLFGPRLQGVVKKFQTLCGQPADGVIGAKIWPLAWTRPIA